MFNWGTQVLPHPIYHVSPCDVDKLLWLHLHGEVGVDGATDLSQGRKHLLFVPSPWWKVSKIKEDIRSEKGGIHKCVHFQLARRSNRLRKELSGK